MCTWHYSKNWRCIGTEWTKFLPFHNITELLYNIILKSGKHFFFKRYEIQKTDQTPCVYVWGLSISLSPRVVGFLSFLPGGRKGGRYSWLPTWGWRAGGEGACSTVNTWRKHRSSRQLSLVLSALELSASNSKGKPLVIIWGGCLAALAWKGSGVLTAS